SLAVRLVSAFQQYMDDGIDPMVQALESQDYTSFYFINTEYGMPRAEHFENSARALSDYLEKDKAVLYANAETAYEQALMAIAASVLAGLVLLIIMRVVFQRVVVRRLREAQNHFDRIANGDLTQRIETGSRNE